MPNPSVWITCSSHVHFPSPAVFTRGVSRGPQEAGVGGVRSQARFPLSLVSLLHFIGRTSKHTTDTYRTVPVGISNSPTLVRTTRRWDPFLIAVNAVVEVW